MKKMKRIFCLSIILLMVLILPSCGGSKDPESTSSSTTSTEETVTFTVKFEDYSGVTLGTASVKRGTTAVAPVIPTREGYTFTGWSGALENVTSNQTVVAQYEMNSGTNLIDVSYALGANRTVTLTYAVKGTVCFCGMDGSIDIPQGFTLDRLTQGNGTMTNEKDGKIYFMFADSRGMDVKEETVLFTLTFSYDETVTVADFTTTVSDIYDQNYRNVSFSVIGERISVR